ncbi:MAG TPA: hypothetical protein VL400_27005, partial [Polyangiaceae bacterium]|nr:hypothetical protein [Polyangiaceae bacterium]
VARREGAPYDPARILVETDAPTPTGLPLVRLVDRLRAPAKLVALEDVSSATPVAPSASAPLLESSASPRPSAAGSAAPRAAASAASLGPASSASASAGAAPTSPAASAPVPMPDGSGVAFVTSAKQVLPLRIFGANGRVWLDES